MALSALIGQLKRIGQMLNRWGAEFRFTVGIPVVAHLRQSQRVWSRAFLSLITT
jgi:hypothetical protein